jgi:hypothetical protein
MRRIEVSSTRSRLPNRFRRRRAIGAGVPDNAPPLNLSRSVIEAAINDCRYQLRRVSKKIADEAGAISATDD